MFYFNFLKGFFKCSACRYICATHVCLLPKDQKRMSNALELELQVTVNSHAGAGNQT